MEFEHKEIGVTHEGELIIKTKGIRIIIPPHLPLKITRIEEKQSDKLVSFCREKERIYPPDASPHHQKVTEAIKEVSPDIYQSYFLTRKGDREKIHAFSEVWLNGVRIDCLILGPSGAILVEVKPVGAVAQEQLERSTYFWEKQFPKIPSLTLKASYRGNKVTFKR